MRGLLYMYYGVRNHIVLYSYIISFWQIACPYTHTINLQLWLKFKLIWYELIVNVIVTSSLSTIDCFNVILSNVCKLLIILFVMEISYVSFGEVVNNWSGILWMIHSIRLNRWFSTVHRRTRYVSRVKVNYIFTGIEYQVGEDLKSVRFFIWDNHLYAHVVSSFIRRHIV